MWRSGRPVSCWEFEDERAGRECDKGPVDHKDVGWQELMSFLPSYNFSRAKCPLSSSPQEFLCRKPAQYAAHTVADDWRL